MTPCVAYAATLAEADELAAAGADFVALGDAYGERPTPRPPRPRQACIAAAALAH